MSFEALISQNLSLSPPQQPLKAVEQSQRHKCHKDTLFTTPLQTETFPHPGSAVPFQTSSRSATPANTDTTFHKCPRTRTSQHIHVQIFPLK